MADRPPARTEVVRPDAPPSGLVATPARRGQASPTAHLWVAAYQAALTGDAIALEDAAAGLASVILEQVLTAAGMLEVAAQEELTRRESCYCAGCLAGSRCDSDPAEDDDDQGDDDPSDWGDD
jgi:hypothetical protein